MRPRDVGHRLFLAAFLLAVMGAVALSVVGFAPHLFGHAQTRLEEAVVAGGWVIVGTALVARSLRTLGSLSALSKLDPRIANLVRNAAAVSGYLYVIVMAFAILRASPGALLLGSATFGLILGIAAQATLGNLFGGLLLLVARPFVVEDDVTVHIAGADYTGHVREITLFYTVLDAQLGRQVLPNSLVAAAPVRVERTGGMYTAIIEVPHTVDPDRLRQALEQEGAVSTVLTVEDITLDHYTARIEVPPDVGPEGVLRAVNALRPSAG